MFYWVSFKAITLLKLQHKSKEKLILKEQIQRNKISQIKVKKLVFFSTSSMKVHHYQYHTSGRADKTRGDILDALRGCTVAGFITVYSSPAVFGMVASESPFISIASSVDGEASGVSRPDTKDSFRGGGRLGGKASNTYRGPSSGVFGVLGVLPRRARSGSPLGLS